MAPIKPKMLFVDDKSKRIHYAIDRYGKDFEVTICGNVPEALRLLSSREWDVVSLDHDLNGHDFEDPESPGCGMEILRYIEKCGGWPKYKPHPNYDHKVQKNKEPEIWIHTTNLFAGHLMVQMSNKIGLRGFWKPINHQKEYIQYDEKGIPK